MKRVNRRHFLALASVGGAGAFLAACNDENGDDLEPTMIDDVEGAPPTLAAFGTPPDTTEAEDPGEEVEAGQTEFEVLGLDELAFDPPEMTIPADTEVTVNFVNAGVLEHDWIVDGYEGEIDSGVIPGGEESEVTFSLPEGEYEYYCSVPGHRDGGMEGILHVVPEDELAEPDDEDEEEPDEEEEEPEDDEEAAAEAETELEVVGLDSLAFEPSEMTIPADTEVTLTFVNEGVLEHDWVVDGFEGDADTDIIPGGEETEITFSLPAGEYEFYCSVPGHRDGGMAGTIIVE